MAQRRLILITAAVAMVVEACNRIEPAAARSPWAPETGRAASGDGPRTTAAFAKPPSAEPPAPEPPPAAPAESAPAAEAAPAAPAEPPASAPEPPAAEAEADASSKEGSEG